MKKLPCARHPANHLLVQELAVLASLTNTHSVSPFNGQRGHGSNLYEAARAVAEHSMSYEEIMSYANCPKALPSLGILAKSVLRRRVHEVLNTPPGAPPSTPALDDHHALGEGESSSSSSSLSPPPRTQRLPISAPARILALYGPLSPLPPLPSFVHDAASYDEAHHHLDLLKAMLRPYGFRVSLAGSVRRGCPSGPLIECVLSLTQEATERIESARLDTEEEEAAAAAATKASTASACTRPYMHQSAHGPALQGTGAQHSTQPCSKGEVIAATDTVSSKVAYQYARAIKGLCGCGYIIAGTVPTAAMWSSRCLAPKVFSVRYDPQQPTVVPALHTCEVEVLGRLKLHRVVLDIAPCSAFYTRCLFTTGPPAFTAHLVLKAIAKGYELNVNGLFQISSSTPRAAAGGGADSNTNIDAGGLYQRVVLESEKDIFTTIGVPYVHPINRGLFCQENHLSLEE